MKLAAIVLLVVKVIIALLIIRAAISILIFLYKVVRNSARIMAARKLAEMQKAAAQEEQVVINV